MKTEEIIRIKNDSGYMTIQLVKKLSVEEVGQSGIGYIEKLRWEFYVSQDYGNPIFVSTIYSDLKDNRTIYLSFYSMYSEDDVEIWCGNILQFEHENNDLYFKKIEQ